MKRILLIGATLAMLAALAVVIAGSWMLSPATEQPAAQWVWVERGASLGSLARELESRGVLRDARALVAWGRLTGADRAIQAGRYRLHGTEDARAFLDRVVSGDTTPVRVSFFEGIWANEVAALLADSLPFSRESVTSLLDDVEFRASMGIEAPSLEGYLFPATYDFEVTETAEMGLAKLINEGNRRWDAAAAARAAELGMSRHEVLTLASIIEAETGVASERALVSAVYHRRLNRPMLLQADPTIVYGLGVRGRELRYRHLEQDSPYNTYRRMGLPPTPIGNPGQAAIDAALYPDTTTTALYFVARGDGSHVFSDTFQQHRQAIREYRK